MPGSINNMTAERHNPSNLLPRASLRASRPPMGPRTRPSSSSLSHESSNRDSLLSRRSRESDSGPASPTSASMSGGESPPRLEMNSLPMERGVNGYGNGHHGPIDLVPPPPPPPPPLNPSPTPSRVASLHAPSMNTIMEDTTVTLQQQDFTPSFPPPPPPPPPPSLSPPPPFSAAPPPPFPFASTSPLPSPSRVSLTPSPSPSFKPIARAATLPPPPKISFDSAPITLKGMPLEAALWTFDSTELQTIVSRAIRSSAQESFIRLLSIDNLDRALPAELERLTAHKAITQSKYRFNIHRRTMLLQALMSYGGSGGDADKGGGAGLVVSLAMQLSDVTAACDMLAEELVKTTDEIRQITKLLDVHWASALAIALRKLNGSYGKRTAELITARDRIGHLKAELEDAWKEAQRLAEEMDDLEARRGELAVKDEEEDDDDLDAQDLDFDPDEETGVIATAELVALPSPPATMTTFPGRTLSPQPPQPQPTASIQRKPSIRPLPEPARSFTPPPPPMLSTVHLPLSSPLSTVTSPTATTSATSPTSAESADPGQSRVGMVTAARQRSLRASMGSLRLSRKISMRVNANSPKDLHPPVPEVPKEHASTTHSASTTPIHSPATKTRMELPPPRYHAHRNSFLNMETESMPGTPNIPPPDLDQTTHRTTLDDIEIVPRDPIELRYIDGASADDMYVMPLRDHELEAGRGHAKRMARRSADHVASSHGLLGPSRGSTIPSIWMNADAPKTPAERVELMEAKGSRFKALKHYSLPFPAVLARTLSTRSAGSR